MFQQEETEYGAAQAFDNDTQTRWATDGGTKQAWIAADLGKLADVKYEGKKALVCIVGEDIRGQNGIAVPKFERLGRDFSGKICFACPVSYQTTGISGTRDEIRQEVRELVECLGNKGGGLIGLIPVDIMGLGGKRENIDCMLEAFAEFGAARLASL